VQVSFSQLGQLPTVPQNISIALYRVAQEALRNALTHSRSDRVDIELAAQDTALDLTIADKGCGFVVESQTGLGLGLSGMAERMKNVGGTLSVISSPSSGTTVKASIPAKEYAAGDSSMSASAV